MVVDDGDLADGLQQRAALHLIGAVGVHHDEDGISVTAQKGILTGDDDALVLGHRPNLLDELLGGVVLLVQDDVGLLALLAAQAVHAQGSAHGIHVRHFVTHDVNVAGFGDELHQGIGGDPGAHLAPVVDLLAPSAVEGEVQPILDDRLIAAAAQAHLHCQSGELIALLKGGAVHAQTEADGRRQPGGVGDRVHLLQDGELVGDGILQIPLLEDQQIAVALHAPQQSVVVLRPGGDGLVDVGVEVGGGGFGQVLGQLLIVVDEDDGNNGTGTDILVPDLVQLRQVGKVQRRQKGAVAVVGVDGVAVDAEAAAIDGHIEGILLLAVCQPVHLEIRDQVGDLLLVHPLPEAADAHEGIVRPDQRAVAHAHQRHGEGSASAVGVAQGIGGGLDEGLQLPAAVNLPEIVQGEEDRCGRQLRQRQISVSRHQRGKGKQEHHKKVRLHARLQQSSQLPIHTSTSVIRVFLPIVIHSNVYYSILEGITQPVL